MSVSNVERALKTLAQKDIIRIHITMLTTVARLKTHIVVFLNYDMSDEKLHEAEFALQFKS